MEARIEYQNPEGLHKNPAFSQIVTTQGEGKTIYIGGQNALNKDSKIIGKHDIFLQTDQVMKNIETAHEACNAKFENLVKLGIHVVQGHDAYGAFQVSQKFLGHLQNPPVITVLFVSELINPEFLIEIDAVVFVPVA